MAVSNPANMSLTNSTLRFNAPVSSVFDRSMTINGTDTFYTNLTSIMDGIITGQGALVKTGNGRLTMASINSYTGGTIIKEGTLFMSDNNNPLGPGSITLLGGKLAMAENDYNTETFTTPIQVPAGCTAAWSLDVRCNIHSKLTGAGTLTHLTYVLHCMATGRLSQAIFT
jgi:autotransporter-associated beta strand protein